MVSRPLSSKAGIASRTPAPGRFSVRANRGSASSSLPIAASHRSKDRSSGLRSKLVGSGSRAAIVPAPAALAVVRSVVRPEGASAGVGAASSLWPPSGRQTCGCGLHPSRRSRFRIAFSDKPSRTAIARRLRPCSLRRRMVRSRPSIRRGSLPQGRPRIRPRASSPPEWNLC